MQHISIIGETSNSGSVAYHGLPRCLRGILLGLLGLIYAGCVQFFLGISSALLYGTYAVIGASLAGCLFFEWSSSRRFLSTTPYLIFTLAYFIWGAVAVGNSDVTEEAWKTYLKNILVIGALCAALDKQSLRSFSQIIQFAAIGNFLICVWESFEPELVAEIAYTREEGATAFNVLRPAGLWSNPDEAAFAFIFALLIGRWAGTVPRLLGFVSSLVGIYLGASRTGAYLLTLCGIARLCMWARHGRVNPLHLVLFSMIVPIVLLIGTTFIDKMSLDEYWQLQRMLDLTESSRGNDEASRVDIATEAFWTAAAAGWHGTGLFTFQGSSALPCVLDIPAHNIYLVVWGEAGPVIGLIYLLLLTLGLHRATASSLDPYDRLHLVLMWFSYLIIGFTWHNQFTSFSGMFYIGLLWHLPKVLNSHDAPPHAIQPIPSPGRDATDKQNFARR